MKAIIARKRFESVSKRFACGSEDVTQYNTNIRKTWFVWKGSVSSALLGVRQNRLIFLRRRV